ncbi:MAG TPA: hypothetical protein VJ521_08435, partial [Acidobacteriota bacterium]|nr:hypothetical protein [Acidobacteriota bacterium]
VAIVLVFAPATEQTLRISTAYGFFVLVGFFGHMIVGMKPKILSIFSWYHAFDRHDADTIPRPIDMPNRVLQIMVFVFWVLGIGLFAGGVTIPSRPLIPAGALSLLCGLLLSTANEIWILKHIWKSR